MTLRTTKKVVLCVTLCGALPFYIEKYLKAKNKKKKISIWENSNISPGKKYNLPLNPIQGKPQNPSRYYYNSYKLILSFNTSPKIYISSFKNPHMKLNRPIIIYYLGAPKSIKLLYILYNGKRGNETIFLVNIPTNPLTLFTLCR